MKNLNLRDPLKALAQISLDAMQKSEGSVVAPAEIGWVETDNDMVRSSHIQLDSQKAQEGLYLCGAHLFRVFLIVE